VSPPPVAAGRSGVAISRIMLVDDHPIVRRGLRRLIESEPDLEVCGEAATVREARHAIRESVPDAVVADISLRDGDGIELVTDLHAHHPGLPVLVLSMHDETIYAERLITAGARGYIMKQAAGAEFIAALRRVLGGGVWVSDAIRSRMLARFAADAGSSPADPIDRLSNRELQVLQMIGRGLSTREMADSLSLSIKTVESHRQRIKSKLGLATGAQLVQFASSWVAGPQSRGRADSSAATPGR
jgi:DNA-binding NarL/FixJ family response regulator